MTATMAPTTTTAPASAGPVTPDHFERLVTDLDPYFINREPEIRCAILALVAKAHMFLLSTPGTGKSMLVTEIVKRITSANVFMCMLDRFADDSLLFGPTSLAGLKEGRRRRETKGYMPHAEIVFTDEIWKASSAVVNTMLQAINERVYFDDGELQPIPLHTLFCASNELPQQDHGELQAIYDRIGLRRVVPAVTDPADQLALLRLPAPPANPQPVLTWEQITEAHGLAMALPVAADVEEAFVEILTRAVSEGVPRPSGRRMREAMRIVRAQAWLEGAQQAEVEHLEFLEDYLWDDPDQRTSVAKAVLSVAAPQRAETRQLRDAVAELITGIAAVKALDEGSPEHQTGSMDLLKKVKRAAHEASVLERAATGRAAADVADTWSHIERAAERIYKDLFDVEVSDLKTKARAGDFAEI